MPHAVRSPWRTAGLVLAALLVTAPPGCISFTGDAPPPAPGVLHLAPRATGCEVTSTGELNGSVTERQMWSGDRPADRPRSPSSPGVVAEQVALESGLVDADAPSTRGKVLRLRVVEDTRTFTPLAVVSYLTLFGFPLWFEEQFTVEACLRRGEQVLAHAKGEGSVHVVIQPALLLLTPFLHRNPLDVLREVTRGVLAKLGPEAPTHPRAAPPQPLHEKAR